MKEKIFSAVGFALCCFFLTSCSTSNKSHSENIVRMAAEGKKVFEAHGCNQCHYLGDELVEAKAPDLTNPMLATDSLFVQAHLKFVEESKMPPITLAGEEIQLVSYYIAALHSAKHRTVDFDKADEICPVCYAPVSRSQAIKAKLYRKFLDEYYYFECKDCLEAFVGAPEVYSDVWKQRTGEIEKTANF